jgi:hypothetical protein
MTGDLNMNTHDITGVNLLNTLAVSNIVTNTGASTAANIPAFSGTTGKIVTDSGLAQANLLLRTGRVAMTGGLNMNGNNITNINAIRTIQNDVIIGNAAGVDAGNDNNVVIVSPEIWIT